MRIQPQPADVRGSDDALPSAEPPAVPCTSIQRCRGCRATELAPVLELDPMPLAGWFCATPAEAAAAPVLPLTWTRCAACGLVQVGEDVADEFLFSRYNYASSTVPGLVRHFDEYAAFLADRYGAARPVRFLEIGCNDGVLLSRLPSAWRRTGVDPSDVAARAAADGSAYDFHPHPFSADFVAASGLAGGADVVSGSNCLAHISDLRDVFEGVRRVLRPGGHFWIEVHDLDALLASAQWDTIYHEHKAEWDEGSLARCLAPLGFEHVESHRRPLHGGLLRVCFRSAGGGAAGPAPRAPNAGAVEDGLRRLREAYRDRYDTPAARTLAAAQEAGERIAAYGAAGRANVYLNQMRELRFAYIVDESPLRAGKYIPRVGTPIVGPAALAARPASQCLVTAWNYRDDIVRKNPQHRGGWLTAFSAP
ncbi:MAG TPA: methyltransferase domain-containing protein [Gemmatimonadaceae bacterium]|nr:methyltransferase domain-containing protein [Gemmatimonadaceae bacterium]